MTDISAGILWISISAIPLIICVYLYYQSENVQKNGVFSRAVVIDFEVRTDSDDGIVMYPVIEYINKIGEKVKVTLSTNYKLQKGTMIGVRYLENEPNKIDLASNSEEYIRVKKAFRNIIIFFIIWELIGCYVWFIK